MCSSISYSIGLNSDREAEMLLKDLQYLISLHQKFYQCAVSESQHSSEGNTIQVDGVFTGVYVAITIYEIII